MKIRKSMLIVLVMLLGLMVAVQPVAGQPPHAETVSGYSCAYLDPPGVEKITGQATHVNGHVLYTEYFSENNQVLPDGYMISIVNMNVNTKTATVKFHRLMTIYPDGVDGTFEGVASGWARFGPSPGDLYAHVSGVLHGTRAYEGLKMKLTWGPGDITLCRPDVWDIASFSGYIIPAEK